MAPVALAGRVDARTVLLADDDEDFRVVVAAVRQQLAGPRATAPERAPVPRP